MSIESVAMAVLLIASFGFFGYHVRRLFRYMLLARQPINRGDRPLRRLGGVITFVFGNKKLFKDPIPGIMHFTIFWKPE